MTDPIIPHLRTLPSGSLSKAEVNWLCDEVDRLRALRLFDREGDLLAQLAAVKLERDAALARAVPLWTCPKCAFTMAAEHTDTDTGECSCPVCEVEALRARAVPDLTPCPFCTPEGLSREDEYVVAGAAQTLDGDPPFSEEALLAVGGDLLAIVRRLTKEPK